MKFDVYYLGSSIDSIIKSYYIKLMNPDKKIALLGNNKQINVNNFYSWSEIKKHNKPDDAWIVISINSVSNVFDVTKWIPEHPGGPDILIKNLGMDATNMFEAIGHPKFVYDTLLPKFFIGFVLLD